MLVVALVLLGLVSLINGHGYMQDPPARNAMWRFGFPNPPNYNDNENFCGGREVMIKNKGRCGVCGDRYDANQRHADGGVYANNIITRKYKQGQVIDVEVLLTTAHLGHFEFRIGDFSSSETAGNSIGKLKGRLMELIEGGTKHEVKAYGRSLQRIHLKLPEDLVCKRCVIQWWYRGGNNWGCDSKGCGMGHGAQEHFVNCADISIQ